jgi:hypothetical protein
MSKCLQRFFLLYHHFLPKKQEYQAKPSYPSANFAKDKTHHSVL